MSRSIISCLVAVGLTIFTVLSCGGGGGDPSDPPIGPGADEIGFHYAASDLSRDQSPSVPPSNLDEMVDGNTEFAFDLYDEITKEGENLFYSPYSISIALAMTYGGARGNTETQMADTMHFTLPQNELHSAFNLLDLELESRGEGAEGQDGEGFRLKIANSTWGETTYMFIQDYLDLLALNYGAGMSLVDFMNQPEKCRQYINWWVEDQTEERIKDLLPEGIITQDVRLVLVNAIYFNAAWNTPFEEESTQPGQFQLLDDSTVTVPMMGMTEELRYAEGNGWQACEMEYDGEELSMVILLPERGRFDEIEGNLDADFVNGLVGDIENGYVHITMPKFEFEAEFGLSDALKSLGMTDAFMPGLADLSGMDGTRFLFIMDVVHKSFVSVDEAGTEAAAATAVIIGFTSAPADPAEFKVDRPFIFFIRDIETDAILFVGRVMDPSA